MTITISHGAATSTPYMMLDGYTWSVEHGNQLHEIIGSGNPDVTFNATSTRRGSLSLFYIDGSAARAAFALHKTAGPFTIADSAVIGAGLDYVPAGAISLELDGPTQKWILTVPYREVIL